MSVIMPDKVADPEIDVSPGDKNYAHIVNAAANQKSFPPSATAREMVALAKAYGLELIALCGYRWVPKLDPDKLDACPICIDVAGMLMRNEGQ